MNDVLDEGYVLNIKTYKESDAMIWTYLKNHGLKHFIYRGYYKPGSKRLGSGLPFHLYQFRYREKDGLITPKEIVLVNSYSQIQSDMKLITLGQIINGLFLSFHQHLAYSLYEWCVEHLNKSENPNLVFCLTLIEALNQMGLQPYVDGDVMTHSTKINHFDIQKGGMIYRDSKNYYTLQQLRLIRTLFKAKPSNYSIISNAQVEPMILNLIVDYFEFHSGHQLVGYQLYLDLQ